jgi:hypothetical protein
MAAGQVVSVPSGLVLRYASAADVRRDRLPDVKHGVLLRTKLRLEVGDRPPVTLELEKERITIQATGDVRWVTPLLQGSIVGVALVPATHRDGVQLDLVFGVRTAGPPPERIELAPPAPIPTPLPEARAAPVPEGRLSVAMLQPNPVLRQVLAGALTRFGREKGPWDVAVDTAGDAETFLATLAAEPRRLAIIDADALGNGTEPLLATMRRDAATRRLPVIILSSEGLSRLEDSHAVSMRKPFEMKAFLDLTGILVAAGA